MMSKEPARSGSVVAIMAKQPVAGRTKTRLSPPLTAAAAAELYEALLSDTIALVSSVRDLQVAVAITPASTAWRPAAPAGAVFLPTEGADIGACLSTVISRLFERGFSRVMAMDSDSPTLPAQYIEAADALLSTHDVVVGPSEDGGYYLVGLKQPCPELFCGISWSTADVTAQTLTRAALTGRSAALLPVWYDVDTAVDLQRLRIDLAACPARLLRSTRRFLAVCPPALLRKLDAVPLQRPLGNSFRKEMSG